MFFFIIIIYVILIYMSSSLKRHEGSYGIVFGPQTFKCIDGDPKYKRSTTRNKLYHT